MSVVKPAIDDLLEKTDHNRFLLSALASQRASDINNMLRGQHNRVLAVQDTDDLTVLLSGKDTISMAMRRSLMAPSPMTTPAMRPPLAHRPVGSVDGQPRLPGALSRDRTQRKNRARFERILMDSCKAALAAFSVSCVTRISGHILITFSTKAKPSAPCR